MLACRVFGLALLIVARASVAAPQAATRDELDAFGIAFEASDTLIRIKACENFLARYPHSEFREKILDLEFAAFEQRGDREAVKRVGARILEADSRNARILAALARAELSENPALAERYASRALSVLTTLRRSDDMNRNTWIAWKGEIVASSNLTLGLIALRNQKYEDAVKHLSESVRIHPNMAEWQHDLGLAYFETKRLDSAEAAFRRAHEAKPNLRGTLIFLGITELRLGKFAAASKDLREAIVLEPQQREAWLNLLRADEAMGKFDESVANRAAGLFPEDAGIQFAIAESALDEIREIAKRANALGPEDEQFRSLNARKKGEELHDGPTSDLTASYDRLAALVARSFESVLRLSPDSVSGHIARGYLEEAQNHVDAAIAEYRQGGDHFAAGRLFAQNSRLPDAEHEFQIELGRNPANHLAMADLAEVYIQQDQVDKARPLLETLLKTYPRDAWAWLDLGKVQQRQENWQSSAISFENALAIDPSLAPAHYRLSISYRKSGQTEKAMAELKAFRDNQNTQAAR